MPELFDMIAGSESGAIIAATLLVPNATNQQLPKYSAVRAEKFYDTHVDSMYKDN